jgi:hypothetical protein
MNRQNAKKLTKKETSVVQSKFRPLAVVSLAAAIIIIMGVGVTAYAANSMLHGHVRVNRTVEKANSNAAAPADITQAKSAPGPVARSSKLAPELINRYGKAATSPLVAAAISKVESAPMARVSQDARLASDRYEALEHGYWRPGTDPMAAVMAGYVPPGMPPEEAALLYGALPHTPMMPQSMTPERIAAMAGEPADPMGFSQSQIQALRHRPLMSLLSLMTRPAP